MGHPPGSEIRLTASPSMLEKLRSHPQLAGEDDTATFVTTYFDTIGGRLWRGGADLRIRDLGGNHEQTLGVESRHGASGRRKEWKAAITGDCPEPSGFPVKARSALARLLDGAALEAVATIRIERTTRRFQFGGSTIAIAFDFGAIQAGGREESVCELEMELAEGNPADVLALARALPLGPELGWSVGSEADRCHALAFDLPPAAAHARPVKLSPAMDVAQGFQAIAWNCLEQLLANYPLVIASGDPEGLHQARVAIRRLRAAGSLFDDVTRDDAGPMLRAELRAVATGLGPARDLSVLHARVASAPRDSDHDFAELLAHIAVRRDAAVRSARTLLAAETFQRLLVEFAAWLEAGEWLSRQSETGGDQPLAHFASRVLSRRRRKLRRVRDHLSDLPDEVRHRLRIDVKKLRYTADFFASLYTEKSTAKLRHTFAKSLGRLQDSLGELNDMVVATAARDALFSDIDPITAAREMAQLDGLLASQAKSRRKLLKAAERSLAEIAEAPAWWKAGQTRG